MSPLLRHRDCRGSTRRAQAAERAGDRQFARRSNRLEDLTVLAALSTSLFRPPRHYPHHMQPARQAPEASQTPVQPPKLPAPQHPAALLLRLHPRPEVRRCQPGDARFSSNQQGADAAARYCALLAPARGVGKAGGFGEGARGPRRGQRGRRAGAARRSNCARGSGSRDTPRGRGTAPTRHPGALAPALPRQDPRERRCAPPLWAPGQGARPQR